MRVAVFDHLGNGFAIGDLRCANFQLHAIGALEDVDFDVQMQFAHAFKNGFARVFVGLDPKGRILGDHLADGDAHLFDAALVLRRHRN